MSGLRREIYRALPDMPDRFLAPDMYEHIDGARRGITITTVVHILWDLWNGGWIAKDRRGYYVTSEGGVPGGR